MKKILLIFLFSTFILTSYPQQRAVLPDHLKDVGVQAIYKRSADHTTYQNFAKAPNVILQTKMYDVEEHIVGRTFYDLQSNKMLQNRIYRHEDGTVGAVWTMGMSATAFPDRGTGYNYYDGSNWGPEPEARIENIRTGWPSYAPWGPNGEMVASHDFATSEIILLTRNNKGTGVWTQSVYEYSSGPAELSWPRLMTSGENHEIVHLLANSVSEYEGMVSATVYSRSLDGGDTWEDENIILDGMDSDYYNDIPADEYVWAEPNGGAIAFLVASAWHDLFMMKSEDNGESWEKTVIWEHPYPFFDWDVTITDTFYCVDNSASIALDSDGMAHVVFGINRVLHDAVGTSYFLFPFIDGIGYWNEEMPTFSNDINALAPPQYGYPNSEMVEDMNYIGYTQDVNGNGSIDLLDDVMYYRELGLSTMPTIAITPGGTIYVAFASTTETYDNFDFNYKKIWMRVYYPGIGWSGFTHLTEEIIHIFDESIYPVFATKTPEGEAHLLYNNDATPGTALDEEHDYQENRMTYMKIQVPVGVEEQISQFNGNILESVYPNPSHDYLFINLNIQRDVHVSFEIHDMLGRKIQSESLGKITQGERQFKISYHFKEKGTFLLTIKVGDQLITERIFRN